MTSHALFQAKTQDKTVSIELPPCFGGLDGVLHAVALLVPGVNTAEHVPEARTRQQGGQETQH